MRIATAPGNITLLNTTYEPLSFKYTMKQAARLLSLGKAVVIEPDPSGRMLGIWPWPIVMKLTTYVKVAYDKLHGPPQISKRGVLLRDHYICSYCGAENANTVDHIIPKSQGGKTSWLNLASCCFSCNQKKGDRTPQQAGMKLKTTPFEPKRKLRS